MSPGTGATRVGTAGPVVVTEGLAKHFGDVRAVRSVDLRVPRNSIFGFLGPNGAGKTTVIKMLVGLLTPTAGSAKVLGWDVVDRSLQVRRRVGFLPQQPVFYGDMTARQTLAYAGRLHGLGGGGLDRRGGAALELVALDGRGDRPVAGFSGGERQRLGLAVAQLHEPELLILDEPAAGLDPLGRRDVLMLLERLRDRATVLYSTHILDDVQRVSDTVAIIREGTIISQGPIGALLAGRGDASYRVEITGGAGEVADELRTRPWVSRVDRDRRNGTTALQVTVTDEGAADRHLLRTVLAHPEVVVHDYGRHRNQLEDVFVELVGRQDHRQEDDR